MSAKILSSVKDENNPNLQKQIGCMNGIFQLFDRHHFLTNRCLRNHKKLLPGPGHNVELTGARHGKMGNNAKELADEKRRISTESSRTSTSSSFSSLDHNTTTQQGPIPSGRRSFSETQPRYIPAKQQNSSLPPSRQAIDLRDVVKDSMYREARGLSIKTVAKEAGRSYVVKHIDSPRPLPQLKSGQPRVTGVDPSTRGKHSEGQWKYKEEKDSSPKLRPKDPPRFSYDGRELRDTTKSRLKELPRLSLDSRDLRSPTCDLKSNSLLKDLRRDDGSTRKILNVSQEPSSHRRSSSVITKLMGLEGLPDYASTNQAKVTIPDEYLASKPSHTTEERRQSQVPLSPRVLQKDPGSPQPSKISSSTKSSPRFPAEQAPWRQPDTSRRSHNLAAKTMEVSADASYGSSTIYGEIERRITEREFKASGKDLRALKQILEAMQKTRERLQNQKAKEADLESQTSRCTSESSNCPQDSKSQMWQNQQTNQQHPNIKVTTLPKRLESSIVIMKPVKLVDKIKNSSSPPVSAAGVPRVQKFRTQDAKCKRVDSVDKRIPRDLAPRKSNVQELSSHYPSSDKNKAKLSKVIHISRETKPIKGESYTSPVKISGVVSPRSQQQKRDLDKKNQLKARSSDLPRARTQSNKILVDSGSPNRKLRVKSINLKRDDDQISEANSEPRSCCHQDDIASLQSESNNSLASQMDAEVTSTGPSENDSKQQGDSKDKDPALGLSEDMAIPKLAIAVPSPISVLDAKFCGEDSPSPVKKISTAFTDDESLVSDEAVWHAENLDNWQNIRRHNLGFEFTNNKLENIMDLVHKLKLLNPVPDEANMDYSVALSNGSNPDHQYINKILLASGLLKDVYSMSTPIQLHSSGHLINPDLFHVLEQTEARTELQEKVVNGKTIQLKVNQRTHRQIVFDTVNEILVRKLSSASVLLGRRRRSGHERLKELHSEVDFLQTISNCSQDNEEDHVVSISKADMTQQSEDWTAYRAEMPALVLDIERLIFKDLISEVINDEIAGHQNWPRRPFRQLFTK